MRLFGVLTACALAVAATAAATAAPIPESPYDVSMQPGLPWHGRPLTAADFGFVAAPWRVVYTPGDETAVMNSRRSTEWDLRFDDQNRVVQMARPTADGLGSETFDFEYDIDGVLLAQHFRRQHRDATAFSEFFRWSHIDAGNVDGRTLVINDIPPGVEPELYDFPPALFDYGTALSPRLSARATDAGEPVERRQTVLQYAPDGRMLSVHMVNAYRSGYSRLLRRFRYDAQGRVVGVEQQANGGADTAVTLVELEYGPPVKGLPSTVPAVERRRLDESATLFSSVHRFFVPGSDRPRRQVTTDGHGTTLSTTYEYDALLRPVRELAVLGAAAGAGNAAGERQISETRYTYDTNGNWVRRETRRAASIEALAAAAPDTVTVRSIDY